MGMAIRLFGVHGEKTFGEGGDTADLITQNFPIFFVDTAKDMVEFTYAAVVKRDYPGYLAKHPKTNDILTAMEKVEGSCLTTTYWGILPFRLGGEVVKYRIDPQTPPQNVPDDAADFLATELAERLRSADYRFTLSVQLRTDPAAMPLDQATHEWAEDDSPFVPIATFVLPRQDIETRGQSDYGESLAFNIWRVPPDNAPVEESSIAAVRKAVYAASANVRHTANGQPLTDPLTPRSGAAEALPDDTCIVKAVIYPPVGVARVGNSPDAYYIGPEVANPLPAKPGSYRDSKGRLKREAARFRIYSVNARGELVRELSGPDSHAKVTWQAQLGNTKSAWYGLELALDIPEAASAPPTTLRNVAVGDRSKLAILPIARSVSGSNAGPTAFDDGKFMGSQVYLGELRTDENGRLIVLGGNDAASAAAVLQPRYSADLSTDGGLAMGQCRFCRGLRLGLGV